MRFHLQDVTNSRRTRMMKLFCVAAITAALVIGTPAVASATTGLGTVAAAAGSPDCSKKYSHVTWINPLTHVQHRYLGWNSPYSWKYYSSVWTLDVAGRTWINNGGHYTFCYK